MNPWPYGHANECNWPTFFVMLCYWPRFVSRLKLMPGSACVDMVGVQNEADFFDLACRSFGGMRFGRTAAGRLPCTMHVFRSYAGNARICSVYDDPDRRGGPEAGHHQCGDSRKSVLLRACRPLALQFNATSDSARLLEKVGRMRRRECRRSRKKRGAREGTFEA